MTNYEVVYKNKSGIISADKLKAIVGIPSLQNLCDNLQGLLQEEVRRKQVDVSLVGGVKKIYVEFKGDADDEIRQIMSKIDSYLKRKLLK